MLVPVGAGTSLEIDAVGSGPAVVLVHGWPLTPHHWRHVVPAIVRAGYRAVSVEARGLGERSTGRGDHAKATLAAEVVQALDAIDLRRFAIVGHGWGGTIAVLVAAQVPHRVAALVVEEDLPPGIDVSTPEPPAYPDWHVPLFQAPEGLAERLLAGRFDAVVDAFLEGSAGPARLDFDAHLAYLTTYSTDARLADTLALHRTGDADADAVRRATRRRLGIPGLAIGGRHALGDAVGEALARSIGRVRTVVVPDAGHYPAEQTPDAVNAALIPFLRAA